MSVLRAKVSVDARLDLGRSRISNARNVASCSLPAMSKIVILSHKSSFGPWHAVENGCLGGRFLPHIFGSKNNSIIPALQTTTLLKP
jgi:hypothetical protein